MAQEPTIKLRCYQQEMLEASLRRNVIVAMDTGSGKTHIAIARIRAEIERSGIGRIAWFLTPNVSLAQQQQHVLQHSLGAYHVRSLTGLDKVEKWTEQKYWDAVLRNVHVVVATPAVLVDALSHGFVRLESISLLVFDEAHRALKNHPMSVLMKTFHHPAKARSQLIPHILGLTASPVINAKLASLSTIERCLDAVTVTPKRHQEELASFVHPPELSRVVYQTCKPASSDPLCAALRNAVIAYNFYNDPYICDLQKRADERALKELISAKKKDKTYCKEQLCALDLRCSEIETQLGQPLARWYIKSCINRFKDSSASLQTVVPDISEAERRHLLEILRSLETNQPTTDSLMEQVAIYHVDQVAASHIEQTTISDKARKLTNVLLENATANVKAIIFVNQRVLTTALCHLLRSIPEIAATYTIGSFVGGSSSSGRKLSIADLVDVKLQHVSLQDFRDGSKNLIVATNALEEGIDISACNLVICFDPPPNLVSFVQRRGRARQAQSKYIIFCAEDDMKAQNMDWKASEDEMRRIYSDDTRQLTAQPTEDLDLSRMAYRVPSTGATLTLENAKGHLHHFCDVSISSNHAYADKRPEFDPRQDMDTKLWTATVQLPTFVHRDLRNAKSGKLWATDLMAIRDAAFQAYVKLHQAGLVNDNLLPLIKDHGPDATQARQEQPSIVTVAQRHPPWSTSCQALLDVDCEWFPTTVQLSKGGQPFVSATMWTAGVACKAMEFDTHWNETDSYHVSISTSRDSPLRDQHSLSGFQKVTEVMVQSVLHNIIPAVKDLPVLFVPDECHDPEAWVRENAGSRPLDGSEAQSHAASGLVRVRGQQGRAYVLRRYQKCESGCGTSQSEIVTNLFPKIRDFLHRQDSVTGKNAKYTAEHILAISECQQDHLSLRYAQLAVLLPSILHRIDTHHLAGALNNALSHGVTIRDLSLIREAISSPNACETTDYNRLEYLGDCVLKHYTEVQLLAQHLHWPESYLSDKRDRIVRNSNLAKAAQEAHLDHYILTESLTTSKFRIPAIAALTSVEGHSTRQMSTKTLADVVEAMIGAAYVDGGLERGRACIETLLPLETWIPWYQCFEALTAESADTRLYGTSTTSDNLQLLERMTGHRFRNINLIVEATTHGSFRGQHSGMSYERLEFVGDSVLDMIITPKLFQHTRNLKHWELHGYHEALVNQYILGFACMQLAIESEAFDVVENPDASTAETFEIVRKPRKVHLYDFLRVGPQLLSSRDKAIAAYDQQQDAILRALTQGAEYPWKELVAMNPPKYLCDMVESILGAIYIDTGGDLQVCESLVQKLGILDFMQRLLADNVDVVSPKGRLGMLADRDTIQYVHGASKTPDGKLHHSCTVKVGGIDAYTVEGCGTRYEAEVAAAYHAAKSLENRANLEDDKKRKFESIGEMCGYEALPDGFVVEMHE